jgi:hypothetical protein
MEGRAFGARSSERARRPLTGSSASARTLPEAGAFEEERNSVHFLIAVRLYARQGRRCGQEQARMDGERKTLARSAVAAREGRSILPYDRDKEDIGDTEREESVMMDDFVCDNWR